jgi:fatty-acyl-CoA synthase
MYRVELTESFFPAQPGPALLTQSVGQALQQAAEDSKDKTALVEMCLDGSIGRRWNYGELYETSLTLARRLAGRYPKGTRIAVCAHNIPQWVILEYAAAMAGLVLVTVNPSFQSSEISYVVGQSGAVALFYVPSYRGNPIEDIVKEVQQQQSQLQDLVNMLDPQELFGSGEAHAPEADLPEVKSEDPIQIQYTSGTTGFPKGAILHHCGLLNNSLLIGDRMGLTDKDVWMNFMPMFHTGGCGIGTLAALNVRASIVLVAQFDPALVNAVIEQEKVTSFLAVPTMLVGLLEEQAVSGRDLSSLRAVISGGAMVAPTLVEQAMERWGIAVQVLYGQTECSPVAVQAWRDDSFDDLTTTTGQPLPHTEVSVRDPSDNSVLPINAVGEICIRGYNVMHAYNDNPEATQKTIDAEGWLHSGDLGCMDERGFLKITGRVKEMIIRGGENLFPVEIENAMVTHPDIAEAAVVGVPDPKWGELACCFYRLEDGGEELPITHLREYAREKLSSQKTPTYWVGVSEWPLTASGKIQKFKLKEDIEKGRYQLLSA